MGFEPRRISREDAAQQFNERTGRDDGSRAAANFVYGLTLLRDQLFERVNMDVTENVGTDSMIIQTTAVRAELQARLEIDLYLVGEASAWTIEEKLTPDADIWFPTWLAGLRLGEVLSLKGTGRRLEEYLARKADDRRRAFNQVLEQTWPSSMRAPLVLFRLFPLATRLATALAWSDSVRAERCRKQQRDLLPNIADCEACHGRILEAGERCDVCGNPVWKYTWLND